jgi:3-deoxy-D-manno-octulosonic-acid transferase
LLGSLDRILVQTDLDRRRLLAVGVDPGRVAVGGNLKFDSAPRPLSPEQREELAQELGLEGRTVLVAGSTHPGEEEPCLEALAALRREHPGLALVIAPREVSRGGAVARLAAARGLSVARVSQGEDAGRAEVLVLDVLGRLAAVYALARAAFVGGSLVPVGGHNLLEPAAQGVPVVFGPHTHNFLEMARQLEEAGGGLRVAEGSELAVAWARLLERPQEAEAMGRAGQEFCAAHRGAVARAVEEIAALMGET